MATLSNGSLRERGKGKWQVRYCMTDRFGSKTITRSFDATSKRQARIVASEIRNSLLAELDGSATEVSLIRYMNDYVDIREEGQQIEGSTASNYRSSIKHISRYLGRLNLGEVTSEDILDMQEKLLADELSPDTVAKDHRFLKQVYSYAVDLGHVAISPFNRSVKPPKRDKPKPNALDQASRRRLEAALDSSPLSKQTLAVRLGLYAGLRREEVAALKWGDIDFDARRIKVRRAIGIANGRPYLKGTKTEAGERDVVLQERLLTALVDYRDEKGGRLANDYVLGEGPSFYTPDRITKDFSSLAKALGLMGLAGRRATFHDLRDTFITQLVTAGTNIRTVSYLAGHSNPLITLQVYTSNTPEGMDDATRALEGRP